MQSKKKRRKLIDKIWNALEQEKGGPITTHELEKAILKKNGRMQNVPELKYTLRQIYKRGQNRTHSESLLLRARAMSEMSVRQMPNQLSPEHVKAINCLWKYASEKAGYSLPAEELIHYTHTETGELRPPHEIRRIHFNLWLADENAGQPQTTAMAV